MSDEIPYAEAAWLQFGLMTKDDIEARAFVELDRVCGDKKAVPIPRTMNCPTLGAYSASDLCSRCGSDVDTCQGHFGKETLFAPVFSVSYFHIILKVLSSLCIRCGRALLPNNHPKRKSMYRNGHTTSYKRCVNEMAKHTARNRVCWFPGENGEEDAAEADSPHLLSDEESKVRGYCGMRQPDLWMRDDNLIIRPAFYIRERSDFDKLPIIPPTHIHRVLKSAGSYTTRMFGFDPEHSPLEALMIEVMIIPPTLTRPPRGVHGNKDDLTTTLELIQTINANANRDVVPNLTIGLLLKENTIKPNTITVAKKELERVQGDMTKELIRNKKPVVAACLDDFYLLQRAVASLTDSKFDKKFDGEGGKERFSLTRRFTASKQRRGRMRQNMLGKPTTYIVRGVASPRTEMEIYQLGIPKQALMHCTFPVVVTEINFNDMLRVVLNGTDKYPGCKYVERDGQLYSPNAHLGGLRVKDIVHKHWEFPVIGNRQPSLHRFAIMGYEVVVSEGNTMQGHLAVTSMLNEDFDGDEKNVYLPHDLMVLSEAMHLIGVQQNLMKDGCLVIGFVQHAVLGAYKLTDERLGPMQLTRSQIQYYLGLGFRKECLEPVLSRWESYNGMQEGMTGRMFMHILLPTYDPAIDLQPLTKSKLNAYMGDTIQSAQDMQYAANRIGFLTRILEGVCYDCGITLHIDDCHMDAFPDDVEELATQIYVDACKLAEQKRTEPNAEEKRALEAAVCKLTNKYRDVKGKYALRFFEQARRACGMYEIVKSGAKGSDANLTQNVAVVGQQINEYNIRYADTTSHYFRDELARHGCIQRSFFDGPSPVEYFFHLRAARNGLIAIACGTSFSGYAYRQLLKGVEAVRIGYRNSVCNEVGDVMMFQYGFDATFLRAVSLSSVVLNIRETVHRFATEADECSVEEVEHLLRLRERAIEYDPQLQVMVPVSFTSPMQCADDSCQESVSLLAARNRVAKLWRTLVMEDNIPNNSALECLFFEQLSSRFLLDRGYLACTHVFEAYLERITHGFATNVAPTGDPVGPKAAQDPMQHLTQTNLKIFHISGEKTTIVDSMTRTKEILSLRLNIQQPLMHMHIWPQFEASFNPLDIIELRLADVVIKSLDTPHETLWQQVEVQSPQSTDLLLLESDARAKNVVYVVMFLNKPLLERRELTPRMLAYYVRTISLELVSPSHSAVTFTSDLYTDEWCVTVCMTRTAAQPLLKTFTKDFEKRCRDLPLSMLSLHLQHALIHGRHLLAGVDGIRDFVKTTRKVLVSNELEDGRLEERQLPCYLLMGSNVQGVCSLPEVDVSYTTSNNIHQIFQAFGIAAAQRAIEDNLIEAIESADKHISVQHIKLIAATMCHSGFPAPLTFAGMTSQETASWFKRATFERCLDSFYGAGIQAHKDNLSGVSEAIVVGALISVGTGTDFELIPDEQKMLNEGYIATARSRMVHTVPDIAKFVKKDQMQLHQEQVRLYVERKRPEAAGTSEKGNNKHRKTRAKPDDSTNTNPEPVVLEMPVLSEITEHVPAITKADGVENSVDLYYGPSFMLVPASPKPRKKNQSRKGNKRRFGERDLSVEGMQSLEHFFQDDTACSKKRKQTKKQAKQQATKEHGASDV